MLIIPRSAEGASRRTRESNAATLSQEGSRTVNGFAGADDLIGQGLACRRGERIIFAGLDCRLAAGDALVLTGSNGSGKTSLLRLLATLLVPASGELLWRGERVAADPA